MSSEAIDSKSQRKGTEVIRKRNEELEERYNRVFIKTTYDITLDSHYGTEVLRIPTNGENN